MVHHIHAFTIHVTVLILLKGTLFARSSRLIPDKANLGFRFPCDGPGRGGTCQVSAWDHVFLGLFWMYNCISVTIFHFSWKMQSDVWGRNWRNVKLIAVGGKVAVMPITLGTADFIVHHIHAFTIHVTVLILLKGTLFARSSRLIPDKANLGFRFPCDGPGRGGTCQVSAWDHVFLGLFWMYNCISVVIFHFSWKMQSDVWGTIASSGKITHITGGNFANSALSINGWLRDFLWSQASQVIQSYGSAASAYGLIFLGAHFIWAFSLMFLFSGRGYWQELIESVVWAHNKLKLAPAIQPRALSITQGRASGVGHYLLGGIGTTWSFFLARIISVG
jgi:photosystem I P700 chlorophyll a apoprotein A1